VAAHAYTSVRWGLVTRIKAATGRLALDRRLADGAAPASSPELARRAQVLSGWRTRHALADGLERVVTEAVAPPRHHGADVPVQRDEVLAAQAELLRLATALRAEPAPAARGVAEASLLLIDGSGPVFSPHPPGTLREAAFRAAFHAEAG
jgi:hypothetical protein